MMTYFSFGEVLEDLNTSGNSFVNVPESKWRVPALTCHQFNGSIVGVEFFQFDEEVDGIVLHVVIFKLDCRALFNESIVEFFGVFGIDLQGTLR